MKHKIKKIILKHPFITSQVIGLSMGLLLTYWPLSESAGTKNPIGIIRAVPSLLEEVEEARELGSRVVRKISGQDSLAIAEQLGYEGEVDISDLIGLSYSSRTKKFKMRVYAVSHGLFGRVLTFKGSRDISKKELESYLVRE